MRDKLSVSATRLPLLPVRNKVAALAGPHEPLLAAVKRRKLAWFGKVTRHTPHVTRHTSQVTRHKSYASKDHPAGHPGRID